VISKARAYLKFSYVDFTHDTQFMLCELTRIQTEAVADICAVLPTMNLTTFAETGDLPTDHIPKHRSFIASK